MLPKGFLVTGLRLKGPGKPTASLDFSRGLNVVWGASDTGKTYILQLIDFMLGGGSSPKEIPEAEGYSTVVLGIERRDEGSHWVIERPLSGGHAHLTEGSLAQLDGSQHRSTLKNRHSKSKSDTMSYFFLEASGLQDRFLLKSKTQGTTRSLSFRDIARWIVVDETTIISEDSPVLSGRPTDETVDTAVFRLLLTATDHSELAQKNKDSGKRPPKVMRSAVVAELIDRLHAHATALGIDLGDPFTLKAEADEVEADYTRTLSAIQALETDVEEIETSRRKAWQELRQLERKLIVAIELVERFVLLDKQYLADVERLTTIREVGVRLAQMPEVRCPICGAAPEHHDDAHRVSATGPSSVGKAASAELERLHVLRADLSATTEGTRHEAETLRQKLQTKREQLNALEARVAEHYEPNLAVLADRLEQLQSRRDAARRAVDLLEQLDDLERFKTEAGRTPSADISLSLPAQSTERFCFAFEDLLEAWSFPTDGRVTFSESDLDVMIGGEARSSHGKGVRAITRSAFHLGLLKYCIDYERPHPGIVILDSPLVVYSEPDEGDSVGPAVLDSFFRSTAAIFGDYQVVVLENEAPPADLEGANVIHFTGTEVGRRGFIP